MERNGNKYYVKEDGSYVKGWLDLAGARYYMDPSTGAMKTGWIKDQNQWYLMSQEDENAERLAADRKPVVLSG